MVQNCAKRLYYQEVNLRKTSSILHAIVCQYGKNKGPKTEGNPKELLKSVYPVFPVTVYI